MKRHLAEEETQMTRKYIKFSVSLATRKMRVKTKLRLYLAQEIMITNSAEAVVKEDTATLLVGWKPV